MKKLSFFISLLSIFITPITQCTIEIKTESGIVVEVDESETVANFFKKCRETKKCTDEKTLLLEFANKNRVSEDSEIASLPLKQFSNGKKDSNGIDATVRIENIDSKVFLAGIMAGTTLSAGCIYFATKLFR